MRGGLCLSVLFAAVGCATDRGAAHLQVVPADAPALHGAVGALSSGRLWIGRLWGTLNCAVTSGRLGCWGSVDPTALTASLADLPADARMGCLATESRSPRCDVVDAGAAHGTEVRALDDAPGSELCAVLVGGAVRCWGRDGRTRRVRGIRNAVEVAVDGSFGCARLQDGAVKCWRGRSAAGSRADVSDAVDLDVAAGSACAALRSGRVMCWRGASPGWGVADASPARAVAVGESLACARLGDGGVACWDPHADRVARRIPGAAHIVEVAVDGAYACARDHDDGLWCWGDNSGFGLGDAESSPFLTRPMRVPQIPPAVDVVLGADDACARTVADELWCWGRAHSAVVAGRPAPTLRAEGVRGVALGEDGIYAALAGGLHHLRKAQPRWVPHWPALADTTALAMGHGWGCAVQAGVLQCFRGPLPTDAVTPAWLRPLRPTRPAISTGSAVVSLAAHGPRGCVALADGRVLCWGEPFAGQRGSVAIDEPVAVAGLVAVDAVAIGGEVACARTRAGELWCWGDAVERPRRVEGLPSTAQVAVGTAHICARTEAGEPWCWGRNLRGQLGRGTTSPWSVEPAPVPGLSQVTALAVANDTSCAVVDDGGVECWGDNTGRHASPRGLLHADHAVPVDRSRMTWVSAEERSQGGTDRRPRAATTP